jgi:hypothetical protein
MNEEPKKYIDENDENIQEINSQIAAMSDNLGLFNEKFASLRSDFSGLSKDFDDVIKLMAEFDAAEIKDLRKSEYEKIKEEQLERIKIRNNIFLFHIGATGAIMTHILSNDGKVLEYLVIPWICIIFAFLSYREDIMTEEIKLTILKQYGRLLIWDSSRKRDKDEDRIVKIRQSRKKYNSWLEFGIFFIPSIFSFGAVLGKYYNFMKSLFIGGFNWVYFGVFIGLLFNIAILVLISLLWISKRGFTKVDVV